MKIAAIAAILALLSQCGGPPYSRPNPSLPPAYRDQETSTQVSLGDLGWWQVFNDPELQQLLTVAVAQNYDVQVAAQRIQEAEANYTVVAANLYPQLNAVLSAQYNQVNGERSILQPHTEFAPQGLLTASYEVDLFGKVHSQTAKAAAPT